MTEVEKQKQVCRRRKLMAFMILSMLLYGKHSSVVWTGPHSCIIRTRVFAKAVGTHSHNMRQYMEWLKRFKYLTDLRISHGSIECTLAPPVARAVLFEETDAA